MPNHPAPIPGVCVLTLGCPKNEADSHTMARQLSAAGVHVVEEPETAGCIVVNTCGFIKDAKEESIAAILDACASYPDKEVFVMGCLVERYRAELEEGIPEVDGWFGVTDTEKLIARLTRRVTPGSRIGRQDDAAGSLSLGSPYAYLKISDGCDEGCTFCAIPGIKGAYCVLDPSSILREAGACMNEGARELVLVGQDTAIWKNGAMGLTDLVDVLAQDERLRWIRLMYLQPEHVTDALLSHMARSPKLCRYLDIPFQHANREVLRRMGRSGDGSTYLELLAHARRLMPDVSVRSTFIVGFPGETEEQFEELMEFAGEAAFDHAGAFIYSPEEGTSASRLQPRVPRRVALDRLNRLNAVLVARAESEHARAADSILTVMVDTLEVEDYGGEVSAIARTAGQAPDVDGVTYIEGGIPRGLAPGDLVDVLIVGAVGFDLVGRLASA